jgi:hypothetical protein
MDDSERLSRIKGWVFMDSEEIKEGVEEVVAAPSVLVQKYGCQDGRWILIMPDFEKLYQDYLGNFVMAGEDLFNYLEGFIELAKSEEELKELSARCNDVINRWEIFVEHKKKDIAKENSFAVEKAGCKSGMAKKIREIIGHETEGGV